MPPGANRFLFVRTSAPDSPEDAVLRIVAREGSTSVAVQTVLQTGGPRFLVAPCDMTITMTSPESARAPHRSRHRPVLLREVVRALELKPGLMVVDGTVGAGGHAASILAQIRPGGRLLGLDRDPMMLAFALQSVSGDDVNLVHSSYADLRRVLDDLAIAHADRILLDLGLSSDQLADRERGFGFDAAGPLDLRFDTSKGVSAADWLSERPSSKIADALREFGEEPFADRIAEAIVATRKTKPIKTAADLSELIIEAIPEKFRKGSSHPATRVFQALRIVVNDELGELERMLKVTLPACLSSGGIAALISFHSLEDRMVKNAFRNEEHWEQPLTKPNAPTPSEVRFNPRSRSAKIRIAKRR